MSIEISQKAREELSKLKVGGMSFLRINVVQGGCSGMTYSAGVDTVINEGDKTVFQDGSIRVVADGQSVQHLAGLTIDYSDDLISSGFRFSNPNAVKSCGCGASFGV